MVGDTLPGTMVGDTLPGTMVGIVHLSHTTRYTMVGIVLLPYYPVYHGRYIPSCTYATLYTPGYTPYTRCTHGAVRYVYTSVMMPGEGALGSNWENPLGERLSAS